MGDGEDGSEPTDEPKENVGRRAVERDYVRLCETTRIRRAARTRANAHVATAARGRGEREVGAGVSSVKLNFFFTRAQEQRECSVLDFMRWGHAR